MLTDGQTDRGHDIIRPVFDGRIKILLHVFCCFFRPDILLAVLRRCFYCGAVQIFKRFDFNISVCPIDLIQ